MSNETILQAEAINLAEIQAHPAEALAALIQVVQSQGAEIERIRKVHREYALRTTNEIDELFAKVNTKAKASGPGLKQDVRLNRLEALLIARRNEPLTFAEIGKFLELGSRSGKATTRRQNMTIFGKVLAERSDRFHVFDSATQKGAKMVCLDDDYFSKGPRKV
jgi:hypothetical protein